MKRIVILAVIAGLLYVPGAGATPPPVDTYTGCLDTAGIGKGTIKRVAVGSAPTRPCSPSNVEVTLSGGDITAVMPGTGLETGGTNGEVTIGVDPNYRLPQGCDAYKPVEWNGAFWFCAADQIGGSKGIAFRAHVNSGSTFSPPAGDFPYLFLGTEDFDTGGNVSNGVFTAPQAGVYSFQGRVDLSGVPGGSHAYAMIAKNFAYACLGDDSVVGSDAGSVVDCLLSLSAGTPISLGVHLSDVTGVTANAGSAVTYFSGNLVS